jgi:hypothetical protein
MEPLKRREGLYEFYDSCGRSGYNEFRSLINQWLSEMTAKDSEELMSRMRYGGNREFGACLCELSVHAFLIRSGYKVVVHPVIPGTTARPDFAALDERGEVELHVHHLTYERLGKELIEDVQIICRKCHHKEHGRDDRYLQS